MKELIKVVLVDDHQVVLRGLYSWLEEDDEIDVVGVFEDPLATLESLPNLRPDVVVSDVRMPGMNGLELTEKIVSQYQDKIKVILVSGFYSEEYHITALEAGVSAFMAKDSSYKQIINAIKQSYLGNCIVPGFLQKNLTESRLTKKEKEILIMIARGKKNDEISLILKVSRRTVEHHISTIFRKMDVDCRVSAVMKGIQMGIIDNI